MHLSLEMFDILLLSFPTRNYLVLLCICDNVENVLILFEMGILHLYDLHILQFSGKCNFYQIRNAFNHDMIVCLPVN